MWWKKNKWKVVASVLVLIVLAAAFWYGGGAPGLQGWTVETDSPASSSVQKNTEIQSSQQSTSVIDSMEQGSAVSTVPAPKPEPAPTPQDQLPAKPEPKPGNAEGSMTAQEKLDAAKDIAGGSSSGVETGDKNYSEEQGMIIDPSTGKDKYMTDPVPEGKPLPVEPQDVIISDTAYTCTISISCATILNHMDWLNTEKVELVPEDGWILPPTSVTFYEGESVFNVLQRTCKQQGIHMEFENTPMYNSAYIEGIQNLYEFDCGELSGWMYKVNDWFPNYGCSRYQLKDGDVICWEYTCDLGIDIGGYYAAGG